MADFGFTTYIQPDPPTLPTLAERIALLTQEQKLAILDGFAEKIYPDRLKYIVLVEKDLIVAIYTEIDNIEEYCRTIMRGELLITPEELDPVTGEVITAAVYNTPPATIADLKAEAAAEFADVFTVAQIGAVVDKMIEYCELDANGDPIGDAVTYAAEVIK
jgi:hypothetical protein